MKSLFKPLLFLVSLGLSLGFFEVGARLLDVDYNPSPYWRFHPRLGWTQERNQTFRLKPGEEELLIEFNRLGFRDVDHSVEKPPGVRRLVVLGDSFSEAIQVNLEETYWRRLARLLAESTGQPWEVINLGVGDWGNAQALLALREYGLSYQPDLVVSQVFPLNDICNNSIDMAHLCRSRNDDYRPYFRLEDGRLVETWTQPVRQWLRSRLISFGVLELLAIRLSGNRETDDERHLELARARGFDADPLLLTYAPDARQPAQIQAAWETTEAILGETFRTCRERGVGWVALVAPFEAHFTGAWDSLATALEAYQLDGDYPEKRLSGYFEKIGASSLMLKPIFETHRQEVLPYVGGHFSRGGHRVAAQALGQLIAGSGLLKPLE